MRRKMLVPAIVALFAVVLPAAVALGQEVPPGPTLVYRTSMEVTGAPATFDVINLVLDFAPGARTPVHTHGGHGIVTVLEGEVMHRPEGGEARRVVAGESFIETPGNPHAAGNESQAKARAAFTVLLPKGAEVTTVAGVPSGDAPPGPTVVYKTSFETANPAATFDLVNLVLDFAPGAWTPMHSHGGHGMVTVLEGEVMHRPQHGEERRVAAGEFFLESPGHPHAAGNTSGSKARVMFSILLPKGAELTTVVAAPNPASPPALPNTGEAPVPVTLPDTGSTGGHRDAFVLAAILVLGGATLVRRLRLGRVR